MNDGSKLRAIELGGHGRKTSLKSRVRSERILSFYLGPIYVPLEHHPGMNGGTTHSDGVPSFSRESALKNLVSKTPRRRSTYLVAEQPALFVTAESQTLVVLSMPSDVTQRTLVTARKGDFDGTLLGFVRFLSYVHKLSGTRERAEVFTYDGHITQQSIALGTEPNWWRLIQGGSGLRGLAYDSETGLIESNLKLLLLLSLEVALVVDRSGTELLDESDLVQHELYYSDSELLALQTRPAPRRRKREQRR